MRFPNCIGCKLYLRLPIYHQIKLPASTSIQAIYESLLGYSYRIIHDLPLDQIPSLLYMTPNLDPTIFTLRETEIILLIKKGLSSHEIAAHLNLSYYTIKKHRENILLKIGCKGKAEFRKFILQFTAIHQN